MLKLFKHSGKKGRFLLLSVIAHKLRSLQISICRYLQPKIDRIDRRLLYLVVIGVLFFYALASFHIIWDAFNSTVSTNERKDMLPDQIMKPLPLVNDSLASSGEPIINVQSISAFKAVMDSLAAANPRLLDSLKEVRPGLLDSLYTIQIIINN
jgi:hypothetical protein